MAAKSFRVVPKFMSDSIVSFGIVYPNGETRLIARIEFPSDGQLGDTVETCQQIAVLLTKRIRKSVP